MTSSGIGALCALLFLAPTPSRAQTLPTQVPAAAQAAKITRVYLACEICDAALRATVAFVEFVPAVDQADVSVAVSAVGDPSGAKAWQLVFSGRGQFAGETRTLTVTVPASATVDETRTALARTLRFGLAEYAARSDNSPHLDVTFKTTQAAGEEPTGAAADRGADPWNYWVFRLGASGDRFGEHSQSSAYYSGSVSANRTTEAWKIRLAAYKSSSSSRYLVSEGETFRSKEGNWSVDSLVVKSLGPHWSAGFTGAVTSSSYSNQRLVTSLDPAVEFDFFPYSQSAERSLTLQYTVGASRYSYSQITLYDKLEETMPKHILAASLGFRQPWGTAGAEATFWQSLSEPSFNRQSLYGNVSVRIYKGLSVNGSGSYSRIRDQFYLEKSEATEEEILLRLRQIATGHRFSMNFGFTYSFGSLSNATVNPRFGR